MRGSLRAVSGIDCRRAQPAAHADESAFASHAATVFRIHNRDRDVTVSLDGNLTLSSISEAIQILERGADLAKCAIPASERKQRALEPEFPESMDRRKDCTAARF